MVGKRVIVALSGGVDSTVAALLMKSAGHWVKGVFMHNWDELDETGHCNAEQEYRAVQNICHRLDMPCSKVTFVKEYWNNVFSEMLTDYQVGLTPNPDIWCNERIKFGALLQHINMTSGADLIATGHYARVKHDGKVVTLNVFLLAHNHGGYRADTFTLDLQVHGEPCTYVCGNYWRVWTSIRIKPTFSQPYLRFCACQQRVLENVLFPVGNLKKTEVKQIAIDAGFADVAAKKESMGLCFVGRRKFSNFIKEYIGCQTGLFVTLDGKVVGQHSGHMYYTIGQRSGLSLDNSAYYVASKNVQTNEIVVVPGPHHDALYCNMFYTHQPHWISGGNPITVKNFQCTVKDRRGPISTRCIVSEQGGGLQVVAAKNPFRAVTPGQGAVPLQEESGT
ncbi:tRNA-specific 2-thiouridylase MnmA-like isoform X2 [Dysidea avara]|uniref:tRNA-specific 2-thiouridylase MnmA-like isoform X2 n=1 Tax=Dysidea avara TaxID=196820 RepID=UPI003329F958